VEILKVSDQVAFDTLIPRETCVRRAGNSSWRSPGPGEASSRRVTFSVQLETLGEGGFETLQVQIVIRRLKVAAAVAHVDLLLGVQQVVVEGIVPIVLEQADIHLIHADDAHADVLGKQFSPGRGFRRQHNLCVEDSSSDSRLAAVSRKIGFPVAFATRRAS